MNRGCKCRYRPPQVPVFLTAPLPNGLLLPLPVWSCLKASEGRWDGADAGAGACAMECFSWTWAVLLFRGCIPDDKTQLLAFRRTKCLLYHYIINTQKCLHTCTRECSSMAFEIYPIRKAQRYIEVDQYDQHQALIHNARSLGPIESSAQ